MKYFSEVFSEGWLEKSAKNTTIAVAVSPIKSVKRDFITFEGRMKKRFANMEEKMNKRLCSTNE